MSVTDRYDLVIVGAGPAGCAAGIEATRAGVRALVIDRAIFPRPKTCGDAVSNRGAEVVDALSRHPGTLGTIPHALVSGASAILPAGARIERDFGASPGYIVPRLHLDDLLRRQLERTGAELRQNVAARHLLVEGGRVRGVSTDRGIIRADAVIAADGPGSVAWTALHEPYRRGRRLAVAITAYYEGVEFDGPAGHTEHYFERDLPCGYGWVFPGVDGVCNVGVYQRSDHFRVAGVPLPELLRRFLERHPERFANARPVGRSRSWALPLAVRWRPPGGPGVLTCGDAAYSIDPLSGEGIWQALATGLAAADTFVQAGGRVDARAVARYGRRWSRELGRTSWLRLAVQEAMKVVVDHRLDGWTGLRAVLKKGYGSEAFEASKRLDPRDSVTR